MTHLPAATTAAVPFGLLQKRSMALPLYVPAIAMQLALVSFRQSWLGVVRFGSSTDAAEPSAPPSARAPASTAALSKPLSVSARPSVRAASASDHALSTGPASPPSTGA